MSLASFALILYTAGLTRYKGLNEYDKIVHLILYLCANRKHPDPSTCPSLFLLKLLNINEHVAIMQAVYCIRLRYVCFRFLLLQFLVQSKPIVFLPQPDHLCCFWKTANSSTSFFLWLLFDHSRLSPSQDNGRNILESQ